MAGLLLGTWPHVFGVPVRDSMRNASARLLEARVALRRIQNLYWQYGPENGSFGEGARFVLLKAVNVAKQRVRRLEKYDRAREAAANAPGEVFAGMIKKRGRK